MKFTCTQKNLLHGISQVAPIAGRNSQLPILQNVLIQAQGNILTLTTTDLEIGIKTVVGGKMESEGSCALPAKRLLEYVQQLPGGNPVTLEKKEGKVLISTKGFRAQFLSADPDEYPLLPENTQDNSIQVSSEMFCGAISQTVFSAAREETRPEIRSVFVVWKNGGVHVAATDGFRLAEYTAKLSSQDGVSILIPLTSAQEIVRVFHEQGDIGIVLHDNYVSFNGGGIELTSRLVDGQYPNYEGIIPTRHTTHITVERDELLRALKTLSVFLPKESRRVSLEIRPKKGSLVLRVAGGEVGQGDVSLDVDGDGEDMDVLINIQYLIEGLSHFSGSAVEGYFSGPFDPVVLKRQGENDAYLYIIMPIQAQ